MKKRAQRYKVLAYMQGGRRITSLKALPELGIMDLPKRISELHAEGYVVHDRWRRVQNREGELVKVKEYWMDAPLPKEGQKEFFPRSNNTVWR